METLKPVIDSQYCVPNSISLEINLHMSVVYMDTNIVLDIKKPPLSFHGRRVLCDVSKNPICTLRKKTISTAHGRCEVLKGESKDLLFSVKRRKIFEEKITELDVFLAKNEEESVPDYTVRAARSGKSCDIFAGDDLTRRVARMQYKDEGVFGVSVEPNVDYVFIVALLLIVGDIKHYFGELGKIIAGLDPFMALFMAPFTQDAADELAGDTDEGNTGAAGDIGAAAT